MVSYGLCSQYCFLLLIVVSGRVLTESSDDAENVYSELGNSAFLHVRGQSSNTKHATKWFKGNTTVARYKDGSKAYGDYQQKAEVFPNGTLTFNITTKADEGEYRVEIHNKEGKLQFAQHFKLHLLEKVSTPVMNITCVSEQDVFISCEVRGTTPVTFYLNEQQLTEVNAVFSYDGRKATLKNSISFSATKTFICKVENLISKSQTAPRHLNCAGSAEGHHYVQVIVIVLGVIALIIIVGLVYCFCQKNH
ncbi:T-cell surface antigen CD2-like [Heptranchias perlo]|uniref:T-cell surface antigen CD2-like n=1 Tax=Heptranchias perlo TaxID=212740 RepID=UPI00355A5A2D